MAILYSLCEAAPGDILHLSWTSPNYRVTVEELSGAKQNQGDYPVGPYTYMACHFQIRWTDKEEHLERVYRTHGRVTLHDSGIFVFDRAAHIWVWMPDDCDGEAPVVLRRKGENTPVTALESDERGDVIGCKPSNTMSVLPPQLPGVTTYFRKDALGAFHDSPKPGALLSHFSLTKPTDVVCVGDVQYSGSANVPYACPCAGISGINTSIGVPALTYVAVKWHYGPLPV